MRIFEMTGLTAVIGALAICTGMAIAQPSGERLQGIPAEAAGGTLQRGVFSEAITDADGNAWFDSSGSEIGDKCAWQFQSCVNLTSGNWQLQMEWSNSANGGAGACIQQ